MNLLVPAGGRLFKFQVAKDSSERWKRKTTAALTSWPTGGKIKHDQAKVFFENDGRERRPDGTGDFGFLSQLPSVSAAEAKLEPRMVKLHPEIEPLVRLLEDTPRERVPRKSARASGTARRIARSWRRCCSPACATFSRVRWDSSSMRCWR